MNKIGNPIQHCVTYIWFNMNHKENGSVILFNAREYLNIELFLKHWKQREFWHWGALHRITFTAACLLKITRKWGEFLGNIKDNVNKSNSQEKRRNRENKTDNFLVTTSFDKMLNSHLQRHLFCKVQNLLPALNCLSLLLSQVK